MASLIGNFDDVLQGQQLISQLSDGNSDSFYIRDNLGQLKQEFVGNFHIENLYSAGYPDPIFYGNIFYAGVDFSGDLVYSLDRIFGTVAVTCFIRRVDPGRIYPPYFHAIDPDRKSKLEGLGLIESCHVHIGPPTTGQVFMIEKEALHLQQSGNSYRWEDYRSISSVGNVSYEPFYILFYTGLKPFQNFNRSYIFSKQKDNISILLEDGSKI